MGYTKSKYFTIIPDSGVQFLEIPMRLMLSDKRSLSIYFNQFKPKFGANSQRIALEQAVKLNDGRVVPKSVLNFESDGSISKNQPHKLIQLDKNIIDEDGLRQLVSINNIEISLVEYKDKWLPVPFFEYSSLNNSYVFGPIGWCRMKICDLQIIKSDEERIANFTLVFSFDTRVESKITQTNAVNSISSLETRKDVSPNVLLPKLSAFNDVVEYKLCGDVDRIMEFFSAQKNCAWVDKYLLSIVHNGKLPQDGTPLKYLMNFIYLISFLSNEDIIPTALVNPVEDSKNVPVDLVLDIGNSRTCGLLFESASPTDSYNFKSVQQLQIKDLSNPTKSYSDAFSMRLAFAEFNFGDIYVNNAPDQLFGWPSILRIGEEANRLLRQYDIKNHHIDESANTLSSPKRYLWDRDKSQESWEYVNTRNDYDPGMSSRYVHYPNLTQFVTVDGKFTTDVLQGAKPVYSRGSLMVFVFIELLNHANAQINSHEFRQKNTSSHKRKRYLRNLVITCPTAMSEVEQVLLKEYADTALQVLNHYYVIGSQTDSVLANDANGFDSDVDLTMFKIDALEDSVPLDSQKTKIKGGPFAHVRILPNPKELKKPLSEISERKDWIYDEATTSQILFIYAELARKYEDNFEEYFQLYGKRYKDVYSMTIASLDIGGGTSDLMICNYSYKSNSISKELTPDPMYWETFNIAGDDLLKDIVHQVLINGIPENRPEAKSPGGILREYALSLGIPDVVEKILDLFGDKYFNPMHNTYRKNLVIQIFLRISNKFLQFLSDSSFHRNGQPLNTYSFTYDEIFKQNPPNEDLIIYMNKHFGGPFDFKSILWPASRNILNEVINVRFKDLFKQISSLAFTFKVDLILLTGKPTTIPEIRNMFINELPITPDRIVAISNHKIGTWYPFSNSFGVMKDPKTTVSVGAMIYLLGGELRQLKGLSLNTSKLINKLVSTANYIGKYNAQNGKIDSIILSPVISRKQIRIDAFPYILACKQLKSKNYPSRCLMRLTKNIDYIVSVYKRLYPTLPLAEAKLKASAQMNSSFLVEISRDLNISKEQITIESIVDLRNDEDLDVQYIKIEYMSIENEEGYWLDTGQFILNTIEE